MISECWELNSSRLRKACNCPTWVYLLQIRNNFVYPLTHCLHMARWQYGMPAWLRRSPDQDICSLMIFIWSCYPNQGTIHWTDWSIFLQIRWQSDRCMNCVCSHIPLSSNHNVDRWSYARHQTVHNSPNTLVNVSYHQLNNVYSCHLSNLNIHHNTTCNHVTTV